jgi:hypothetical protein
MGESLVMGTWDRGVSREWERGVGESLMNGDVGAWGVSFDKGGGVGESLVNGDVGWGNLS